MLLVTRFSDFPYPSLFHFTVWTSPKVEKVVTTKFELVDKLLNSVTLDNINLDTIFHPRQRTKQMGKKVFIYLEQSFSSFFFTAEQISFFILVIWLIYNKMSKNHSVEISPQLFLQNFAWCTRMEGYRGRGRKVMD